MTIGYRHKLIYESVPFFYPNSISEIDTKTLYIRCYAFDDVSYAAYIAIAYFPTPHIDHVKVDEFPNKNA